MFLGGMTMSAPIYMPLIIISMIVLSIRALLTLPEKELPLIEDKTETRRLKEEGAWEKIQTEISDLSRKIGCSGPVRLVVSKRPFEARAFGSWRRHYIVLGYKVADQVASDLDTTQHRLKVQALLLHEIAHISNRDVQRIGYTRKLLRVCVTVLPWWTLFLMGWLSAALLSGEAIVQFDLRSVSDMDPGMAELLAPSLNLSPEQQAEIVGKMETVSLELLLNFILSAFLPIIVIGFVLWLFFWRRMLRIREYYADQQALAGVNDVQIIKRAMVRYTILLRLQSNRHHVADTTAWWQILSPALDTIAEWPIVQLLQKIKAKLHYPRNERLLNISDYFRKRQKSISTQIYLWFSTHPSNEDRWRCLEDISQIDSNWKETAWSTAVLVLALEIMLTTPLVAYHIVGYPIHISVIIIFLLVSAWMLPQIVQRKPVRRPLVNILIIIFGLRWLWLFLNLALLVFLVIFLPNYATPILNATIYSQAGFAGIPSDVFIVEPSFVFELIPTYIGLQIVQMISVFLLLSIYYKWQQKRVSDDQGAATDWSLRHWRGVAIFSLITIFLVLTPLSDLIGGEFNQLVQPNRLISYTIGVFLLVGTLLPSISQHLFSEA
jgi:hypothetical protein